MESTAFNHAALNPLHSIGINFSKLHGIHCIQSGYFAPCCMESTAFHHAAWDPLHSIVFHCAELHGIHWIQSHCMESTAFNWGCIVTRCMESPSFNHAVWNPMHSMGSIVHRCMEYTAFNHAACNPRHCIGFHCSTLHGIDCIQSCCIKSMAFHRDPLGHTAWNPLH